MGDHARECTLILAQSKLLVAAREVVPPEDRRASKARGVPGFASESSCFAFAVVATPLEPAQRVTPFSTQRGLNFLWAGAAHPANLQGPQISISCAALLNEQLDGHASAVSA